MEYIDGEDLASLLRRVGRLPEEKGVEIARQLCLALAAVHEQGLLHRDLKPQNVMLDGRGKVRLTDFGLAAAVEELSTREAGSGTPLYMAPEQLAGKRVTARSDLFALGLVLYELFTGKRAFPARNADELRRMYEQGTPPSKPSSHVRPLDPAVERAILQCLEGEPADRPQSAHEVLAALPGGDPLRAALAAGETPSPQVVADAGEVGVIRPWVGLLLLVGVAAALTALAFLNNFALFRRVPLDKPPEEMARQAGQILADLGYADPPTDRIFRYRVDLDYMRRVARPDPSANPGVGLETGQPALVYFFYRQSPDWLAVDQVSMTTTDDGRITSDNPAPMKPRMAEVRLDFRGRLIYLSVVPPGDAGGQASARNRIGASCFARRGWIRLGSPPIRPNESRPGRATIGRHGWASIRSARACRFASKRGPGAIGRSTFSWSATGRRRGGLRRPFNRRPGFGSAIGRSTWRRSRWGFSWQYATCSGGGRTGAARGAWACSPPRRLGCAGCSAVITSPHSTPNWCRSSLSWPAPSMSPVGPYCSTWRWSRCCGGGGRGA